MVLLVVIPMAGLSRSDATQIETLQLSERLISTVVRAFYDDEKVVVIDNLLRVKYLRDKEVGGLNPLVNLMCS